MLVLIAGISGNLGQKLAQSLIVRGHAVRGLGRSPAKLPGEIRDSLESFIESSSYYDIPALDRACSGVDAVICAYSGVPELSLEGNLLLLRAAERAGVRRFVPASWNYDWREMQLGRQESYDPIISLRRQIELTSTIKPIWIFTGVLVEVLFSVPGHGDFSPANNGAWDPETKTMHVWGDGTEVWHWTTERDCVEFTAAILERPDAADGGFWSVCSGSGTLEEVAHTYGDVRSCQIDVLRQGSKEDLRQKALEARAAGRPDKFWSYIGWFYQLYTVEGLWTLRELDNEKLNVKTTSLRTFLEQNPTV